MEPADYGLPGEADENISLDADDARAERQHETSTSNAEETKQPLRSLSSLISIDKVGFLPHKAELCLLNPMH